MVIPKRRSIVPPPVNSDAFLDYCHDRNQPPEKQEVTL
jgi:hypothetical protein